MTRLRWPWILAAAALLAGCGAPVPAAPPLQPLPAAAEIWTDGEGWQPVPTVPESAPPRRWSVPVPVGAETALDGSGVVVLAAPQGGSTRVERLDLATGMPRWSATVPGTAPQLSLRGHVRPVVVVEAGTVSVLDATDGRVLWQAPEDQGDSVDALPDLLLVRSLTGTTAVDRATGTRRWQVPRRIVPRDGALVIDGAADADTQLGIDGVADPATGAARWTQANPLFTDVTVVNDMFVRTADVEPGPDTVGAFDLATGTPRWSADVDGIGRAGVAPLDTGTLLISGGGGPGLGTAAVSVADGRVLWRAGRSPTGVLRLDGAPWAYVLDSGVGTVVDGRTGAARDHRTGGFAELAGGGWYTSDGGDVVATGLADLAEHWRIPGFGDLYGMDAVPGGIVAVIGRAEPRELVAHLS